MTYINGVNLLPGTGEFTYDTVAHLGYRPGSDATAVPINVYESGKTADTYAGEDTDFIKSIAGLDAEFPQCTTVALVIAWFFNSRTAGSCSIYPSTTYINGSFYTWSGSQWVPDSWRVSGLTQASSGLIPISSSGGRFSYGGTPSDQAVFNAIRHLKDHGKRVVFYPFLLGDIPDDFPWRGRITHTPDKSSGAAAAIAAFLGAVELNDFAQDLPNRTVDYLGASSTDWSYRRMILHYANLCAIAGGVDLFLIGSELRGLETIRGSAWTKAGAAGSDGKVTWDYPFVDGLKALSDDVRTIFDTAGLTKNPTTKKNLISYAADWSVWMGSQHPGEDGQWPHLDQLYGHSSIDLVCLDNYHPLSDWTTGIGGIDVRHWSESKPSGSWPPPASIMNGLGLTGAPTLLSKDYFKANIEGGEKFDWYYAGPDANLGRGFDPNGAGAQVSRPEGNRLAQIRSPFYPDQELLASKHIRWWWKHSHKAIYDTGSGWVPQGSDTKWVSQSKSVAFTEYGFPTCDRATNQPNVFFDPKSSESFSPFWSVWESVFGGDYVPRVDRTIVLLALQAIHEYWFVDGNNMISGSGIAMLDQAFTSVWAWDARPFPTFPQRDDVWGDAPNWSAGNWIQGKRPFLVPASPGSPPGPGRYPAFPVLVGEGWSVRYTPVFATIQVEHVSGREARSARTSAALLEIEITYDVLRNPSAGAGSPGELEALVGFFAAQRGAGTPFTLSVPAALGLGASIVGRFADDRLELEEFMARLWRGEPVKIEQLRGE